MIEEGVGPRRYGVKWLISIYTPCVEFLSLELCVTFPKP